MSRPYNTSYHIQVRMGREWTTTHIESKHNDALHYVRIHPPERYSIRIIRVVKTIVFEALK